ncbi:hypothetical protein J1N35_022199 [Gossypium stocksii]|uniref:Uncharacterized protein n=1 Tax=Gossypium stocksii TaxID=47602 RepID=A0A9D3VG61_9ROSI|nr:hypothetical protein J1N35_022199 [Gossypium stocksii]
MGCMCVCVPFETLQEAMDSAYGEGGANYEVILSYGCCFTQTLLLLMLLMLLITTGRIPREMDLQFGRIAMIINSDPIEQENEFVFRIKHDFVGSDFKVNVFCFSP